MIAVKTAPADPADLDDRHAEGIVEGMRLRPVVTFALLVSLAAFHATRADLDVDVRNGDRIVGTIDPVGEVETYRFALPKGAKLKITAKGKKTRARPSPPRVRLRLLDRYGRDVSGDSVKNGSSSARVRGFVAPESGAYAVEVRGDAFRVGDYSLTLKWKTSKRLRFKNVDTSAGLQELDFAADAGALIDVTAKGRKSSDSRPVVFQLLRVDGQQTETVKTFTFPPTPERVHHVEADIRDTGDHRLIVRDGGGFGGPTDVTLKIATEKGVRDVDVTDALVGDVPAGFAVSHTLLVDAAGAATPANDVPALTIPADAVPRLRPIQLGAGDAFDGPASSGLLPIGDAVYVGPERVQFDRLVDIVLPYDPAKLPEGTDWLRVVRLDSTGLHSVLSAQSVVADEAAQTASCPIAQGGLYGAFRLVPPPKPTSITPQVGSPSGFFPVVIGGTSFRTDTDPDGKTYLQITLDGEVVPVKITYVSSTLIGFEAPPHGFGKVTFGVRDRETGVVVELASNSFTYQ